MGDEIEIGLRMRAEEQGGSGLDAVPELLKPYLSGCQQRDGRTQLRWQQHTLSSVF